MFLDVLGTKFNAVQILLIHVYFSVLSFSSIDGELQKMSSVAFADAALSS